MKKLITLLFAFCLISILPTYADLKRDSKVVSILNDAIVISGEDCSAASFQLQTDMSWDGTITFQATTIGNKWITIKAINANTEASSTTATSDGIYILPIGGFNRVRAYVSAIMAGSAVLTGQCGSGQNAALVSGSVTASGTVNCNAGANLNTSLLATSLKQDTGNTSLSSIDGKITACNTGAVTVSSLPNVAQPTHDNLNLNANIQVSDTDVGNANPVPVNVVSGSAADVQYTEGDTDATITGNAILWEDAGNALATVSASMGLPVNVVAGSTAGTEFSEDSASMSGDNGTQTLAVRELAATDLSAGATDGDYEPLEVDDHGRLWVNGSSVTQPISGTVTCQQSTASSLKVDLSGTAANSTAIKVDGSAVTQPVSISGNQAVNLAQINGVTVTTGSGVTGTGVQRVVHATDVAVPLGTAFGGGDGVTYNTITPSGTAGTPGVLLTLDELYNGTSLDTPRSVKNSQDTTGTGIQAVGLLGQFDDTSPSSVTENQFANLRISSRRNAKIEGDVASGTATAANPLTVGGRAGTTNPTAVADGQAVNWLLDKLGKGVIVPGCARELIVKSGVITLSASTAETTLLSSVASTFLDVFAFVCANTSATATRIDLRDSTAGTIQFPLYLPAADTRGLTTGIIIPQTTAANNWTIQSSASVTDVRCVAFACKNL